MSGSSGSCCGRMNIGGMKRLSVDLVILNEKPPSYEQELQGSLDDLVRASQQRISSDPATSSGTLFSFAET